MSTNRSRRIDRTTAEQLLSGATDGTHSDRDALAGLLAATRAHATASELAGEEAVLSAFREAAHLAPARPSPHGSQPRRRTMADCVPARFLSVKVAAVTLAATALGGVAVAASTGNLPLPLSGARDDGPAATPSATPSGGAAPGLAARVPGTPEGTQALTRLCQDWRTTGPATADPRFEPLAHAAGGRERIASYCRVQTAPTTGAPDTPQAGATMPETARTSPSPSASHGRSDATDHPGKPTQDPTSTGDNTHTRTPAPPAATASGHAKQ